MIYGDISHSRTVSSVDPEASVEPSGENETDSTEPECPSSVAMFRLVATSHNLTVPSSLMQALNHREKTKLN